MVIPYAQIPARWWDSHFLSIDYSFGRSSVAAHLHVCLQDGRIVTVAEIVVKHMAAYEFANEIVRRFEDYDAKFRASDLSAQNWWRLDGLFQQARRLHRCERIVQGVYLPGEIEEPFCGCSLLRTMHAINKALSGQEAAIS